MMNTEQKPSLIQDLWERRFFQYIGTYLGVSFGLIQFAQFIEDRYDLQNNLVEKALIFLLVMLPAVALYIYNHGRRGHDEWKPIEKVFLPASLIVSLGLSLFLFNNAETVTQEVAIKNEEGKVERRVIPAAKTAKRLVLFPFQVSSDTVQWQSIAFPFLLDADLEQDMRTYGLQPFQLKYEYQSYNLEFPQPIPFSTQLKIAQDNYSDYFISGTIVHPGEGQLSVIGNVYHTNSGELFYSDTVVANNLYNAVDLFSREFNSHLYLKDAGSGQTIIDLPAADLVTGNAEALDQLMQANLARLEGPSEIAAGVKAAEKAVELDNRCAECYATLSSLYLATGQEIKSSEAIESAVNYANALPERQRLFIGFMKYMTEEHLQKALILLENWRKLYPSDLTPYSQLMDLYKRTMQVSKAKEVGLEAIAHGHRGKLLTDLAQLYIDSEQYEEAEKYLEEFSNLYPHKAKERSLLGQIYTEKGELEKALKFYEELSILQSNEVSHTLKMVDISDRLGRFSESENLLITSLQTADFNRDSINILQAMEEHYDRLGQFTRSFEILDSREKLIAKNTPLIVSKPAILFNIWPKLFFTGRDDIFFQRLNELKELLPERANLLECVANYLYASGKKILDLYESISEDCKSTIIQNSGKNFEIMYKAVLHHLRGEYANAAKSYEMYLDSTGLNDKRFSTTLSEVYRLSDQLDEAEQLMERNLKSDPNQPLFLLERAKIFLAKGEAIKASECLNSVLSIWKNADPEYTHYQEALELQKEIES